MRLLVLTAAYPSPAEPERAVFLENLNLALLEEARGALEIAVVTPRVHRQDPRREVRRGIPVRRFPSWARGRRLKDEPRVPRLRLAAYLLSALCATAGELRRRRSDLLLAHWVLPAGLVAAIAAPLWRRPRAVYAHGSDVNHYARISRTARALARLALAGRGPVLASSRALRVLLEEELGVDPARLHHVPMGVGPGFTPGDREAARRDLSLGGFPEILWVGDLTAAKGTEELLRAAETLAARRVPARFHLAGDGPLREAARAFSIRCRPVVEVRLLGLVSQERLVAWYRASDLLVHPSRSEGSPVAVMEALACGLPVLATRVGGVGELVEDGVSGVLVPPGDPEALANALESLLGAPERREALRRGIASRAPDHSAAFRARAIYPLLAEVARGRPA